MILPSTTKMQTVTAAVLVRNRTVLIARRTAADRLANKWEFPGGKLEDGETPEACLARELKEELGITVRIGALLGESLYHYEHGSIKLLAYLTYWDAGNLDPKVHAEVRWASLCELDRFDFAPADVPFVKKLMSGDFDV